MAAALNIAIVEPEPGGHHFHPYLAFLVAALVARGDRPLLLTSKRALAHPAMLEVHAAAGGRLPSIEMPDPGHARSGSGLALIAAQFRYRRAVAQGWRALDPAHPIDLVLVMGYDSMGRALALLGSPFGSAPFIGLTIQTKHHWPALGIGPGGRALAFSRWCFERVLKRPECLGILSIDQTLVDAYSGDRRLAPKLRWLPDPGQVIAQPQRAQARAELGLPLAASIVLVYGVLDARKNVPALLRAARQARSAPFVVLAGRCAAEVRDWQVGADWTALAAQGRVRLIDGYIGLADEARLYAAADLVWVGYCADFNGQSAVIAQAASAGRALLGRRGGLIGRTIESHGLGEVIDPDDVNCTAAALDRVQTQPAADGLRDNLRNFAATRSRQAHADAWLAALAHWTAGLSGGRSQIEKSA